MSNGRCKLHGGATPSGLASPHTKTGRYSKDLPTRLLARFESGLDDPELINLRREVSLIDSRIGEMLQQVEQGEAGHVWGLLQKAVNEYRKAEAKGEPVFFALNAIFEIVERGVNDILLWREIQGIVEQRRKLVESESKRQVDLSKNLTLEQVGLFYKALTQAIKEEVAPDVLGRINAKFSRLTEGNHTLRAVS